MLPLDFTVCFFLNIQLLGDLAPIVGSAVCKNYLSADLHALSQDNSFRVRKATVQYFGPICEQLGARDAEESLLPIFLNLCSDSIWSVRKGILFYIFKKRRFDAFSSTFVVFKCEMKSVSSDFAKCLEFHWDFQAFS